jgi:Helix-turn-helix domain
MKLPDPSVARTAALGFEKRGAVRKSLRKKTPDPSAPMHSPPAVAKKLVVAPNKVLGWIRRGQLRAFNVASNIGGRPRWRISADDLEKFLALRQSTGSPEPRRSRRRTENVTEYF